PPTPWPALFAAASPSPLRPRGRPPARRYHAQRNHEASRGASRESRKASRGRHGGITKWGRRRHGSVTIRHTSVTADQMTRSLPPSTGTWAPVVLANSGPHISAASSATSRLVTSTRSTLFLRYSS